MSSPSRIQSIDLLRGAVMVIMALDHTRDFFHLGSFFVDPTDLATTTPALFFTRWITHFCAPVFVFLAGTAAYLHGQRLPDRQTLSRFLWTRGLWLVFLELTVIKLAWSFDLTFSLMFLQVIWAIGMAMIFLSALIYLPYRLLVGLGILIVAGHNLLDAYNVVDGTSPDFLWALIHQQAFLFPWDGFGIFVAYPLLAWTGVMILGYVFGRLYRADMPAESRHRVLYLMGGGAIVLFVLLRWNNVYGDPAPWSVQDTATMTVLSFLNCTKYPPSLLFLLMTLGPSLIVLAATERARDAVSRRLIVFGRVPLFYYVTHLYILHLLAFPAVMLQGRPWTDMVLTLPAFLGGDLATYGYSLPVTYLVWAVVVVGLYFPSAWYQDYKRRHRERWWLSYL